MRSGGQYISGDRILRDRRNWRDSPEFPAPVRLPSRISLLTSHTHIQEKGVALRGLLVKLRLRAYNYAHHGPQRSAIIVQRPPKS